LVDGSCFFFSNFRKDTYRRFTILFPEEQEEQQNISNPPEPQEVVQSVIDYYYHSLMLCAGDDLLKVEPVLKKDLMEVLGYLSYRIDKANKEAQRAQNAVRK
jgi:hypothetical protein